MEGAEMHWGVILGGSCKRFGASLNEIPMHPVQMQGNLLQLAVSDLLSHQKMYFAPDKVIDQPSPDRLSA